MDSHLLNLVLAGACFAWFTPIGWRGLRHEGAGFNARLIYVGAQVAATATVTLGILVGPIGLAYVGVLAALALCVASRPIYRRLRSPDPAEQLLKAFVEFQEFDEPQPDLPLSESDQAWVDLHLKRLERWRTPTTSSFIDLLREATIAQYSLPQPDPASWAQLTIRLTDEARLIWKSAN